MSDPTDLLAKTASRIPADPYARPRAARPDALRLDGNEGRTPDAALLAAAVAAGTEALRTYPSVDDLAGLIAARFHVGTEHVIVTAGGDDALDRICRSFLEPGRSAVLPIPTFEMLRRLIDIAGGEPVLVPWTARFPVAEVIDAIRPDTSLVAVVSPNNPTGATIDRAEFGELAARAGRAAILLDHAYVEYADDDLTAYALSFPNVIVVRTFSKAWGLAGCRVGYALADPRLAAIVRNAGNPYPVAGTSVAVVAASLGSGTDDLAQHVMAVRQARTRVCARLERHGVPTPTSQGNFVFPDFGERAGFAYHALQFTGIVTRRFPDRPEIANGLRISMPCDAAGLDRLDAALSLVLDPEALLLDLDGVIADVGPSYRQCVLRVTESYGVPVTDTDVQAEKRAGDANNDWVLTHRLLKRAGVDARLDDVIARYQTIYLGDDTTPGLRERERLLVDPELLATLREGRRLGIVTGRPRAEAEWFLRRHGVRESIDVLVCMEDGPAKPDPFPILHALEQLDGPCAWMVGDTPDDMRAAVTAGVVPIGVLAPGDDPPSMSAALTDAGAVTVIDTLATLKGWM